ncbi:hypothetical protein L4C36_22700 [Photobacterium japonica]|uniref:hypothetical protein n=1 Tax=Photobacterium japonica TaxID=2910235 RepID=UPI003D0DA473
MRVRKCNLSNPMPAITLNGHLGGFIEVKPGVFMQPSKAQVKPASRQVSNLLRVCCHRVRMFFI